MAGAAALLIWLLHNAPYVEDEWGLLLRAQEASLHDIFDRWNGHFLAVGQLLAYISIPLVGLNFWLLAALDIVAVLACSVLVYVFARPRLGPILALAPALVPLFFSGTSAFYGTGIQLTPLLGVNGIYALDFGLAAFFLLERVSRRRDASWLPRCSASLSLPSPTGSPLSPAPRSQLCWRPVAMAMRLCRRDVPLALYCIWRLWSAEPTDRRQSDRRRTRLSPTPLYSRTLSPPLSAGFFGLSQTLVGRGPALTFARPINSPLSNLSFPLFLITLAMLALVLCVARQGPGSARLDATIALAPAGDSGGTVGLAGLGAGLRDEHAR